MDDTTASIVNSTNFDSTKVFFSVQKKFEFQRNEDSLQSSCNSDSSLNAEYTAQTKLNETNFVSSGKIYLNLGGKNESCVQTESKIEVVDNDEVVNSTPSGVTENVPQNIENFAGLNCTELASSSESNVTTAKSYQDEDKTLREGQLQPCENMSSSASNTKSNTTSPDHMTEKNISMVSKLKSSYSNEHQDATDSGPRNKPLSWGKVKIPNFKTNNNIMGHENFFFKRLSNLDKK